MSEHIKVLMNNGRLKSPFWWLLQFARFVAFLMLYTHINKLLMSVYLFMLQILYFVLRHFDIT